LYLIFPYQRIVAIRWAYCVIFHFFFFKFSSGAFQDGGKEVNYFVASIPASFGQKFYLLTQKKMAENQQKNIQVTSKITLTKYGKRFAGGE